MKMNETLANTVEILRSGGVILYPTDTIWGIGCDATNEKAVSKIYKIKQREDSKSMLVLVDQPARISSYVDNVPEIAWDLIDLADKPLTIIFSGAKNLAKNLAAKDGSVGIRVVKHDFCQKLIQRFKKPIVSTSANIAGKPFPRSFEDIDEEIKKLVDLIVPQEYENSISDKPSGIIMLGPRGEIKVIRE